MIVMEVIGGCISLLSRVGNFYFDLDSDHIVHYVNFRSILIQCSI